MERKEFPDYEKKYEDPAYLGGERVEPQKPTDIPIRPTIPEPRPVNEPKK